MVSRIGTLSGARCIGPRDPEIMLYQSAQALVEQLEYQARRKISIAKPAG